MHMRRITDWQDGAAEVPQSDEMDVDEGQDATMEARPHAYRPCDAPPRPRRCSRGCSALWNLLTLVLCRA